MFGFVKPYVPELRNREHVFYKSVYCGVCRAMKEQTGRLSSLALSYDIVFLALIRLSALGEAYTIKRERCIRHPIKKRAIMQPNGFLSFSARISADLAYYKCKDDVSDESGIARFSAGVALPYADSFRRRAAYPEAEEAIKKELSVLSELEKTPGAVPDSLADSFGRLLGELASLGTNNETARILREIGFHLGRWIYLADAVCDYPKDYKKGRFNPFLSVYDKAKMKVFAMDEAERCLTLELSAVERAYSLLPVADRDADACIRNILFYGMKNAFYQARGKEWTE